MRRISRFISLLLCLTMAINLCACGENDVTPKFEPPTNDDFWQEYIAPEINITELDKPTGGKEEIQNTLNGEESTYDLVYENISYTLTDIGFTTKNAMAINYDDDTGTSAIGLMYYRNDIPIFADETYQGTGFYEILSEGEDTTKLETVNTMYVKNLEEMDDTTTYLAAYDYQDIGYDHFIYNDKYIMYYQESDNVVRYVETENIEENYDISLGSLYDFDSGQYIYDASIFDEYVQHSGNTLISEQDYAQLEKELQKISEQQLANGYRIEEFNVVYISPENIQAYLESKEKDTFFGYNVADLEKAFGAGTALSYTEEGFQTAQILESSEYNWKSFLTKVGIGCGIIFVGAVIAPITGGASFGCSLLTTSSFTVGASFVEGVGTLAIETAIGMAEGKSIEDALNDATDDALDAFANNFLIMSAVSSVGVCTGLIKPKACFVEGTPITVVGNNVQQAYIPIEKITVGTSVYSYNEITGIVSTNKVTDVFSKQVTETIELVIDDEVIITTAEHPFYLPKYSGWCLAGNLKAGDSVLNIAGKIAVVESVKTIIHQKPITVYNFAVENDNTYFVGKSAILVHNKCDDIFRQAGNKAGEQAKKDALEDIVNGRNYEKWGLDVTDPEDLKIIEYVQKNKTFKGSGCEFAHGVDVNQIKQAYTDGKITREQAIKFCSDPNNGILTNSNKHRLVIHAGNTQNPSNISVILQARPCIKDTIDVILQAIA